MYPIPDAEFAYLPSYSLEKPGEEQLPAGLKALTSSQSLISEPIDIVVTTGKNWFTGH